MSSSKKKEKKSEDSSNYKWIHTKNTAFPTAVYWGEEKEGDFYFYLLNKAILDRGQSQQPDLTDTDQKSLAVMGREYMPYEYY